MIGEAVSVVADLLNGGTVRITAAMVPDDNRLLRIFINGLCPDVQILAVFAVRPESVRDSQFGCRSRVGENR